MFKKVMGFDVSSSVIGYSLLEIENNKISFKLCDYYKPIKSGNIFERLYKTKTDISKIISKNKPDYIVIEDIVQFMKNQSGAKTIISLALFNRIVGLAAFEFLGKSPELISVMSIRHGIKLSKPLPKKEEIPELVAKHLNIKFPYVYKKDGLSIRNESYDMADSIAVALFYSMKLGSKKK